MPTTRFFGFNGENRALHPKLLPDNVCTILRNAKPGRGDLRPWRQPLTVASVPAGRQTVYRMGRDVASDSQYWLSWPTVVHAVRGFETGDTTERTYFTGDGAPKVTDNIMALASAPYPTASRPMGLPAPATALLVLMDAKCESVERGMRRRLRSTRGRPHSRRATSRRGPRSLMGLRRWLAVTAGVVRLALAAASVATAKNR